jgi:hypothetical protein
VADRSEPQRARRKRETTEGVESARRFVPFSTIRVKAETDWPGEYPLSIYNRFVDVIGVTVLYIQIVIDFIGVVALYIHGDLGFPSACPRG